jgi:hypothetical protein
MLKVNPLGRDATNVGILDSWERSLPTTGTRLLTLSLRRTRRCRCKLSSRSPSSADISVFRISLTTLTLSGAEYKRRMTSVDKAYPKIGTWIPVRINPPWIIPETPFLFLAPYCASREESEGFHEGYRSEATSYLVHREAEPTCTVSQLDLRILYLTSVCIGFACANLCSPAGNANCCLSA